MALPIPAHLLLPGTQLPKHKPLCLLDSLFPSGFPGAACSGGLKAVSLINPLAKEILCPRDSFCLDLSFINYLLTPLFLLRVLEFGREFGVGSWSGVMRFSSGFQAVPSLAPREGVAAATLPPPVSSSQRPTVFTQSI